MNIATSPYKTDYSVYDVVDFSGLTLEVIFENGVVITTDHNYKVEEYVLDYAGEKEITLYYKDKSVILTVNVGMGDVLAQGYCGVDVNWILYENGYLNIYGEGMMEESPWLTYADTVKTVVIEEGVTTICEEAFKNCRNISAIHIPTSMETVKYSVFEGVPKIDKMYITSLTAYCNIYFSGLYLNPSGEQFQKSTIITVTIQHPHCSEHFVFFAVGGQSGFTACPPPGTAQIRQISKLI